MKRTLTRKAGRVFQIWETSKANRIRLPAMGRAGKQKSQKDEGVNDLRRDREVKDLRHGKEVITCFDYQ